MYSLENECSTPSPSSPLGNRSPYSLCWDVTYYEIRRKKISSVKKQDVTALTWLHWDTKVAWVKYSI